MRRCAIILSILALLAIVIFPALKTHKGSMVTAFGESTWRSKPYDTYYDTARNELRLFLNSNGFCRVLGQQNIIWAGVHTPKETEEIYRGTSNDSEPFDVVLRIPEGNSCGIDASVLWDYRDYTWKVESSVHKAEAFVDVLARWWEKYQLGHPIKRAALEHAEMHMNPK
jgi:hypothetical protein